MANDRVAVKAWSVTSTRPGPGRGVPAEVGAEHPMKGRRAREGGARGVGAHEGAPVAHVGQQPAPAGGVEVQVPARVEKDDGAGAAQARRGELARARQERVRYPSEATIAFAAGIESCTKPRVSVTTSSCGCGAASAAAASTAAIMGAR